MTQGVQLIVGDKVSCDDHGPRVGGAFLKPQDIEWPIDSDGNPLTLILSIPTSALLPSGDRFPNFWVSVFVKYSATDYCLDAVTCNDAQSFKENIGRTTKVLIHRPGDPVTMGVEVPSRRIERGAAVHQDSFSGSKWAGEPTFLQKNPLPIPEFMEFLLQLYSSDLSDEIPDLLGLPDSVGYLFLPSHSSDNIDGIFFAQCT
ncbi:MAG TPA: hypothetical protein PKO15_14410 [Fibrobacteria bacterium]|nr:hypothetical protein [Fibrobacteria bacterium]HOX51664.1 hypothetical protein [Fibrobacteria bacterium]